ncbi:hypothetical protein J2Z69_000666 [Paenibacillus shirakamiensis]|uniref:Uncharacterized protein n=1 Tax=Paenibacillus shirakamiensis TaxID=1265935 RepID=A0ABS4JD47_9BACL|nr:hypothetical protein [Paenibacillus shirakamiensis]MBP1999647.1 hypothetical protein [Paenibacillus shirakamiensis]
MKKNSVFMIVLWVASLTTIVACNLPNNNKNAAPDIVATTKIKPTIITTSQAKSNLKSYNPNIGEIVKGGSVVHKEFNVNKGIQQFKILMKNYSSHPVSVSLTHRDSGQIYFSKKIQGNSTLDWRDYNEGYEKGIPEGKYILQWSGSDYVVNGE